MSMKKEEGTQRRREKEKARQTERQKTVQTKERERKWRAGLAQLSREGEMRRRERS